MLGMEQRRIFEARHCCRLMSLCVSGVLALTAINGWATVAELSSPEIQKYLVIATGEGSSGDDTESAEDDVLFNAFDMSNVEIGADQELVSNSLAGTGDQRVGSYTGGLDLTGNWVPNDGELATVDRNRFDDVDPDPSDDTVGVPDELPGARPVFEGIDYSGNVAITGDYATFQSSNSDVNADTGIECARTPEACFPEPSTENSYFDVGDFGGEQDLNALAGVSQFDPTSLLDNLEDARDYILSLPSDYTLTSGFVDQNIKNPDGAPVLTDLDAIDADGVYDGIAVIDIDVDGSAFELNNSDWILQSTLNTFVIFRMADGVQFDFSNSSILLGDGNSDSTNIIDELGAIFFMDAYMGTNELFNLNNVILGGIGLWDFTDFNPNRTQLLSSAASVFAPAEGDATMINLQDAQGCAQFISHQVLMSDNRWNRCAMGQVPVPSSLSLMLAALMALLWAPRSAGRGCPA